MSYAPQYRASNDVLLLRGQTFHVGKRVRENETHGSMDHGVGCRRYATNSAVAAEFRSLYCQLRASSIVAADSQLTKDRPLTPGKYAASDFSLAGLFVYWCGMIERDCF